MSTRTANAPIAHALYGATVQGEHKIDRVARVVGVATATVYDWAEGRRPLPAYALPGIYRATLDVPLYAELAGITDVNLALLERLPPGPMGVDDVRTGAMRVGAASGRVLHGTDTALADGVITDAERLALGRELDDLERKAEDLRARLGRAPSPLVRKVSAR